MGRWLLLYPLVIVLEEGLDHLHLSVVLDVDLSGEALHWNYWAYFLLLDRHLGI